MSLFSQIIGGLTGIQTTDPVATQSQNAENGITSTITGNQTALNNQTAANTGAINTAGQNVNTATEGANTSLQGLLNTTQGNLASGIQSGNEGNAGLQQLAASNPTFTAPTAAQVEQTPGYQFQLQQGETGVENQAAANGLSQGGSTLAALTQYGQSLAGTYYQNAFNNAQSQFQTNENTSLANLQALTGAGATANAQSLSADQSLGAPQATNTINAANTNAGLQENLASTNSGLQTSLAGLTQAGATTAGNFAQNIGEAQAGQNIGNSAAIGGGLTSLIGLL